MLLPMELTVSLIIINFFTYPPKPQWGVYNAVKLFCVIAAVLCVYCAAKPRLDSVCAVQSFQGFAGLGIRSLKDRLVVGNDQVDLVPFAMRPHKTLKIAPHATETIIDMEFLITAQGKVFVALSIRMLRTIQHDHDAVMVCTEARVDGKIVYSDCAGFLLVYVEVLVLFETGDTVSLAFSMRNMDPYLLCVVKISESAKTKHFQIKYIQDLLLPPGFIQLVLSDSLNCNGSSTPRQGSSIPEGAITEAHVQPFGQASFEPVLFYPSHRCTWRSSAVISNALFGVERVSLMGYRGSPSIALFDGSEAVQSIEFILSLRVPVRMSALDTFPGMQELADGCSRPLLKELYFKNIRDWPLEVRAISISGEACMMDGFIIHTCHSFSLEPGQCAKFLISYQPDFSTAFVSKHLQIASSVDDLVIPIRAMIPLCTINLCKLSIFWTWVKKKCVVAVLYVLLIIFMFWCVVPSTTSMSSEKLACRNDHRPVNSLMKSVGERKTSSQAEKKDPDMALQPGSTSQHTQSDKENCIKSDAQGSSQVCESSAPIQQPVPAPNVISDVQATASTGNGKGRRRRRKKNRPVVGSTNVAGASSSHSGNLTPKSPLPPATCAMRTPVYSLFPAVNQSHGMKQPFSRVADQHNLKHRVLDSYSNDKTLDSNASIRFNSRSFLPPAQEQLSVRRTYSKAVMLFSRHPAPRPAVVMRSRAPGPEVYLQKTVALQNKSELKDQYTYDIWGEHWVTMASCFSANGSFSFFVKGQETILAEVYLRAVSSH